MMRKLISALLVLVVLCLAPAMIVGCEEPESKIEQRKTYEGPDGQTQTTESGTVQR